MSSLVCDQIDYLITSSLAKEIPSLLVSDLNLNTLLRQHGVDETVIQVVSLTVEEKFDVDIPGGYFAGGLTLGDLMNRAYLIVGESEWTRIR